MSVESSRLVVVVVVSPWRPIRALQDTTKTRHPGMSLLPTPELNPNRHGHVLFWICHSTSFLRSTVLRNAGNHHLSSVAVHYRCSICITSSLHPFIIAGHSSTLHKMYSFPYAFDCNHRKVSSRTRFQPIMSASLSFSLSRGMSLPHLWSCRDRCLAGNVSRMACTVLSSSSTAILRLRLSTSIRN